MKTSMLKAAVCSSFAALLIACTTSERELANQLDRTAEVIQQASSLLAADPELGQQPIVVDGFKGAMRLKGQVARADQKARAEKIVWALRGVKSVENELQVGSAEPQPSGSN